MVFSICSTGMAPSLPILHASPFSSTIVDGSVAPLKEHAGLRRAHVTCHQTQPPTSSVVLHLRRRRSEPQKPTTLPAPPPAHPLKFKHLFFHHIPPAPAHRPPPAARKKVHQ